MGVRRLFIHFLSAFIPVKKWRKSFRDKYMVSNILSYMGDRKSTVIIPLGENCACAMILGDAGLRRYSLPFDWSGLEDKDNDDTGGLYTKCNLIIQDCSGMLNLEDFEDLTKSGYAAKHEHRFIVNRKTGLRYIHDFSVSSSVKDQWPVFYEKYTRRIKRMYSEIERAERVLFIYDKVMKKECYQARHNVEFYSFSEIVTELKKKWPCKTFCFLLFLHDESINVKEYKETHPYENVTYVWLNNMWQEEESYDKSDFLGNRDVVLQYLKEHLTFCK